MLDLKVERCGLDVATIGVVCVRNDEFAGNGAWAVGDKPAKHFTRVERGRFKHKYSRRKNFWDLMNLLLRTGQTRTHTEAIAVIRQAYGASASVTTVINGIIRDRNDKVVRQAFQDAGIQ